MQVGAIYLQSPEMLLVRKIHVVLALAFLFGIKPRSPPKCFDLAKVPRSNGAGQKAID